jgi:hypothetical protein
VPLLNDVPSERLGAIPGPHRLGQGPARRAESGIFRATDPPSELNANEADEERYFQT